MDEELKQLLQKNQEMTEEILKISRKLKNYMYFQQVFSIIKILIIAIPVALGIIYLPALFEKVFSSYQELLGIGESSPADVIKNIIQ